MKKYLRPKQSIPVVTGIIILSVLFGVAYSNWMAPATENLYKKMSIFNTVLRTIEHNYVEKKDPIALIDDAIRGMVKNLDPHTNYMTAEEVKKWNVDFKGYSGIGIRFDIINNKITVMSVLPNGPSEKLGFRAGDRIIKINGESAIGIKRDDVPKKLMGPAGTTVDVTIERETWGKPKDFTIIRKKIQVDSIPIALKLDNKVGYVKIDRFSATTGRELEESLTKLESQGIDRLILDLRGNSGGYLQMAVEVSEKFLPEKKMIVYTKGRIPQAYREYYSTGTAKHRTYPLIVLINHSSASASEIVSGAIQDWDRGLIVGQTSFGKGLVQTQYPLADGSVLMITTARYYTPSGRLIQRDYENKSYEDYIKEAYNDTLRQKELKDLPKFKTFAGRTVYGGGGINPDFWMKDKTPAPSEFVMKLFIDPNRYLYSYSEELLRNHPEIKEMTPKQFPNEFKISEAEIKGFANFVMKKGYKAKLDDFIKGSKDFKYLLKREIAYRLWKTEGQFYVNYQRDTVLKKAKDLFPDAEKLLAASTLKIK
ncbi:MAG TPA: S41 family peptidase [Bacteroidetes bacterium]|nr:S41 family peptidase [Bacteroidota bacterium]